MLLTNSSKYGITTGGYSAEFIELSPEGKVATNPDADPRPKLAARFALAVDGIPAFKLLYDEYKSKKLVAHNVMFDLLKDNDANVVDYAECVDIFIANVKELGLLRQIGGSEHLIPIEQALDEAGKPTPGIGGAATSPPAGGGATLGTAEPSGYEWDKICFYVTPIGDEGSPARAHSDLFKDHIIEPAMVP